MTDDDDATAAVEEGDEPCCSDDDDGLVQMRVVGEFRVEDDMIKDDIKIIM